MSDKPREWWLVHGKYGEHGWSGPNFPWDSRVHVVEVSALAEKDAEIEALNMITKVLREDSEHFERKYTDLQRRAEKLVKAMKRISREYWNDEAREALADYEAEEK